MQTFLEFGFWSNTVQDYLIFLGSLAGTTLILFILKRVVLRRLAARAAKTPPVSDGFVIQIFEKYILPILYIYALKLNFNWLTLSAGVSKAIGVITLALTMIFGAAALTNISVFLLRGYLEKQHKIDNKMTLNWMGTVIKIVIWIGAILLFLEIQRIPITTLIAGLGIGGIAIAFAAQAILEDMFSYVTIVFDRPFEIGDFIVVDDLSGTVEHIGLKTTRVRSITGEQLVFSNKDLTGSRLHNYKRMAERRVLFTIGVVYDTPTEKLREIPGLVEEIISGKEGARFERTHFKEYADFSLNFEVVYFVLSQDFALYMDIQQEINLELKEVFSAHGIDFAFPTQTFYRAKTET